MNPNKDPRFLNQVPILPTLGSEVYDQYLLWASWSPRVNPMVGCKSFLVLGLWV